MSREPKSQLVKLPNVQMTAEELQSIVKSAMLTHDEEKTKKEGIQTRYFMLTYKTHVNKELMCDFIRNLYPDAVIYIGHETGKDGDYEHSHVLVDIGKRSRIRDMKKFDFNDIHPNVKGLFSRKAYEDSKTYISKEDKSAVPESDIKTLSLAESVWQCSTLEEALKMYVKKASDVSGITSLYFRRPLQLMACPINTLRPWQEKVFNIINNCADDRYIYWVLDEKGNSGKSKLCGYIEYHDQHNVVLIDRVDSIPNMTNLFLQYLQLGNSLNKVIIDIPRAYHITEDFYTFLESIKNGRMISTKYMGGRLTFINHCVMVFSNQPPRMYNWTEDRCKVIDISKFPDVIRSRDTPIDFIDDLQ